MKTTAIAFFILGIVLLAGALYLAQETRTFIAQASTAQGTVVDVTRIAVVHFVTEKGENIKFEANSGKQYFKGEKIEVLYQPGAPRDAVIKDFYSLWYGAVSVAFFGSIPFLIGGGILLASVLNRRKQEYLKQYGTRISTTFQSVELNKSLTVNGKHPFRVFTRWTNPLTSEIHVFKSDNLWFDTSPQISDRAITVFIEPGNPKKYHVDLSFLP